nr:M28 family peptidase [Campylobacter sp.]
MQILEYFSKICAIPHCSLETTKLKDFLIEFAKSQNYKVNVDKFGNIHAYKGDPKICLQAHYDMVCVGSAPNLEIFYEKGFIKAKNSSLGADNGIGVAICMDMMDKFDDLEILWTNDEEVGLIGANNFKGKIKSPNLLNLDSEDENEVIIGCAGGEIYKTEFEIQTKIQTANVYKISVSGLRGGHSGIEIIKNIPNAIKVLCEFMAENKCKIINISGGERDNSIPTAAKALVVSKKELKPNKFVKVVNLGTQKVKIIKNSKNILNFINAFSQGIRSYDEEFNMVKESINLAIVSQDNQKVQITMYARAMDQEGLEKLKLQTKTLSLATKAKFSSSQRALAWEPVKSDFAIFVLEKMRELNPNAQIKTIHAGLECGVLCAKNSSLGACSIGPNIYSPHSIHEKCEIASIEKISQIVENIIKDLNF